MVFMSFNRFDQHLFETYNKPLLSFNKKTGQIHRVNQKLVKCFPEHDVSVKHLTIEDVFPGLLLKIQKEKSIEGSISIDHAGFHLIIYEQDQHCNHIIVEKTGNTISKIDQELVCLFKTISEKNQEAMFLTSTSGETFAANPAACRLFGYTEQELIQLGRMAIVDITDERLPGAMKFRQDNGTFLGELRFKRKDGSLLDCYVSSSVFKDLSGQEKNILIIRDNLHSISINKKLFEENAMLQEMSEMGQIAFWEYDNIHNKLFWSKEGYRIHELPVGSKVEVDMAIEFYHPAFRKKILEAFTNCLEKKESFDLKLRFISASGKKLWVRTTGKAKTNEKGEVTSVFGFFQDITTTYSLQLRLRKLITKLANYKHAIYSASIISVATPSGIIKYINNRFEEVSQFRRQEVIGKTHKIFNSGIHPPTFWDDFYARINAGMIWRGEVCNKRKDGSYYWVDTFVIPLKNKEGKIIEFLSIRNDISTRKNYELKIKQSLFEKESIIQELHHRVKNNLQLIASLAKLKSMYQQDESFKTTLLNFEKRIRMMAGIHEQLLHASSLNSSIFGVFIEKVVLQILGFHANKSFFLDPRLNEEKADIDYLTHMGLACLELVILHKKINPQAELSLKIIVNEENFIEIEISNSISVRLTPENKEHPSIKLSLDLLHIFQQQLNGKIIYNSETEIPQKLVFPRILE